MAGGGVWGPMGRAALAWECGPPAASLARVLLLLGELGRHRGRASPSVPTACPTGSSGAQGGGGGGSSAHYAVNSQFTMGGPAISMASPMSIPTNTMHYGS